MAEDAMLLLPPAAVLQGSQTYFLVVHPRACIPARLASMDSGPAHDVAECASFAGLYLANELCVP